VSWWSSWGFRPTITFPVKVTVWPFRLPSTSSLKSYYIMYPGNLCTPDTLAWDYVSPTPPSPDEACINLALRYAQFGLDHRLTIDPAINRQPTEPNRAAQFQATFASRFGPFFEGTNPDGTDSRPRWTKLARAKPSRVSPYPNNTPETFLATWFDVYSQYPVSQTPKWLARSFYYVCDEPHAGTACDGSWDAVIQRSDAAHSYGTTTLVTTHRGAAEPELSVRGRWWADIIDVVTPNVISIQEPGVVRYPAEFEGAYAEYRPPFNQGTRRELWWYQACDSAGCGSPTSGHTGYPELAIDVSGVKNRAMQWMTRRFGMAGELYWDTVHAFPLFNQHTVVDSALEFGGLYGDGTLFYPGYNRPLPSLRLKHLRDGMEDYEYLQLMADRHCARGVAKALFDHARSAVATMSSETLLQYRRYAADEIMAPGAWCPGTIARECDVGWRDCAGNQVCVDLSTTSNCGACGNACPALYACYRGVCTPPSSGCPAHAPYDCGCGEPLVCKSDPRDCLPCE
jgi:hypothetical protein